PRIQFYHPTLYPIRIELFVPGLIERVCEVDPAAVAADLDHLLRPVERRIGGSGMRRAPYDASQMHGSGQLWIERIGNIVLPNLARAPARNIKKTIIEREVDIC